MMFSKIVAVGSIVAAAVVGSVGIAFAADQEMSPCDTSTPAVTVSTPAADPEASPTPSAFRVRQSGGSVMEGTVVSVVVLLGGAGLGLVVVHLIERRGETEQ